MGVDDDSSVAAGKNGVVLGVDDAGTVAAGKNGVLVSAEGNVSRVEVEWRDHVVDDGFGEADVDGVVFCEAVSAAEGVAVVKEAVDDVGCNGSGMDIPSSPASIRHGKQ